MNERGQGVWRNRGASERRQKTKRVRNMGGRVYDKSDARQLVAFVDIVVGNVCKES